MHARDVTTPAKPRVDWVDYAKGICIFFVVMLHVNDLVEAERGQGWLGDVVTFARPFRMPDFFLIAGLFLSASISRPWRRYLDAKIVHFYFFYLLWMTINFVVFDLRHTEPSDIPLAYLRGFIDPPGSLWFIHILPIFFLFTRLTRKVPWWIMLPAMAALHTLWQPIDWDVPDEFARRYVFFYSGYALAPHVFRFAAWMRERVPVALGYLAVWGIVNGLLVGAGLGAAPGFSLALGYAGALAVVVVAVMMSLIPRRTAAIRYFGEHSIVIYLGEAVVGAAAVKLLADLADPGTIALALTVTTIVGTLALWQIALRTPLWFVYRRPATLFLTRKPASIPVETPRPARPSMQLPATITSRTATLRDRILTPGDSFPRMPTSPPAQR